MGQRVLGPVFSFELLTSSRRWRYFVVRALYASILFFALWANYQDHFRNIGVVGGNFTIERVAAFASTFFIAFAWLQMIAVLLLTPAMVAGSIAQEHERRTIEYLLVSPLHNSEIVLSKLLARVLAVCSQLLAGLPVLAIAMLLGGIGPEALAMVFLATVVTLLVVAAMSLAVSTWTRRTRDAITRAYLVLLAWLVVPLALYALAENLPPLNLASAALESFARAIDVLVQCNPFYVIGTLSDGARFAEQEWTMLAIFSASNLLLALLCTVASVLAVRRVAVAGLSGNLRRRRFWSRLRLPTWRPAPGNHPLLWKELFAERAAVTLGWPGRVAAALLLVCLLGATLWSFANSWGANYGSVFFSEYLQFVMQMATMVACIGMLFMTARSAGTVTSEKERDCWLTLISTPLTGREIMAAKLCGAVYASRWWIVLLLLMYALAVVLHPLYLLLLPLQLGVIALLGMFCIALGMYCSLRSATSLRAMGVALTIALVIGGGYLFCCVPIVNPGVNEEVVLSGSIAYLVAFVHFAGMAVLAMIADPGGWMGLPSPDADDLFWFTIGMLLYITAAGLLIYKSIASFDSVVGRGGSDKRG